MRYRDPNCECEVEYPGAYRRWCGHCNTDGPVPDSLADPEWEQQRNDPVALLEAAERCAESHPDLAADLRRAAELLAA
jgi:hypothetical protein